MLMSPSISAPPMLSSTTSARSASAAMLRSSSSSTSSNLPGSSICQSLSAQPPPLRKSSTGSFSKLSDFRLDGADDDDTATLQGVRHAELSIDASEWRHPVFKTKVLSILRRLKVPYWTSSRLTPSSIHLQKVSGALTNAVFFVSFNPAPTPTSPSMSPLLTPTMPPVDPDHPPPLARDQFPPTLLLRIYGPSSGALISRSEELRILHVLSTTYGLGPRVYGTFLNGRVEQFFPSRALTPDELKDPIIYRGIARRMRELHSVDLHLLGYDAPEPTIWRCLDEWSSLAEQNLQILESLGGQWEVWVERFGLHRVKQQIEAYRRWVQTQSSSRDVVFAHNDTQYGNLLKLDTPPPGPEHHRLIVIDFEYAAPNPRGYDIANHFHEWRADYHHPSHSHSLQPHHPYPSPQQREDWYRAYLSIEMDAKNGQEILGKRKDVRADMVAELEREVRMWSPACSVFWALWGIIQAEEQVTAVVNKTNLSPEFDYLAYAIERLEMFRKEARELDAI
ncbi:kinase-like domain-containing protein [Naematelia encephala]|uniref:Kinase-like domain-containing protein n=1 Tax=Naematelia encephala TaxID=71784 RepID=A0A1Y2BEX0_9TREE|nr:kinase-like domain-containing protein [Naematelia encephala]